MKSLSGRFKLRDFTFGRFVLVGSGCFLLNLFLLYATKELLHLHYLLASALALWIVSGVGFFLNRKWTFEVTGLQIWRELLRYYIVNSGGFLFNLLLIALLVDGLKVNYIIANVAVGVSLMLFNFWMHKNWSFRTKRDSEG